MSQSGEGKKRTQKTFCGKEVESLCDRFDSCFRDKPDTVAFSLGSPVSPLRTSSGAVTNTSSSSSSSGRAIPSGSILRRSDGVGSNSSSGELSSPKGWASSPGKTVSSGRTSLIYSGGGSVRGSGGGSSVSSPPPNALPVGNIFPSGMIGKMGIMHQSPTKSDVLGLGSGNYGHGSVIRGNVGKAKVGGDVGGVGRFDSSVRRAMESLDVEEVKRVGNEMYRKGEFTEALRLYDRAIALCPDNAACRSNRAAALMAMERLGEAVSDCEVAVRLDPEYDRAHQRLVSLYLRLGQVENARRHLNFKRQLPDPMELQKLQAVEKHLNRCIDFCKMRDWKNVMRESDAAITSGSDSSLLLIALKAEALLRLHRLDEADSILSKVAKLEILAPYSSQDKFLGMHQSSYMQIVRAQVEMALGRFENAELAAERAKGFDPQNAKVARVLSVVKSVAQARVRGKELFSAGNFIDACLAYGEGLECDPSNPILYCNRAVCHSKLGEWEKSIRDCNEALKVKPNYTKALLRRAASYAKLERWAESVQDYEVLRKELPSDTDVAEALFHAQVALKASRGEEISNLKFSGEVEKVVSMDQFEAKVSSPGVSVVHFMAASNRQCSHITPFVDTLCSRYPSVNFFKVDINENPAIARSESVRIVPTFKIYKNGSRMKELICPSQQVLESSVRHYGL